MLDFVASGQISELLLEHSPAAIAVFDLGMNYVGASRHWRDDYGIGGPSVAGVNHYELFPEAPDTWRGIHRRVVAGETLSNAEEGLLSPDGMTAAIEWQMMPWRDQARNIGGTILFICPVAGSVAAEELANQAAQLQAILETVPDAMITIDEQGIIGSYSAAAEKVFGYSAAEVIGQNVGKLLPEADAALHNEYLARYCDTGKRWAIGRTRRVTGRRKDGTEFSHELRVGEASANGRRIFTGFVRDLTEREEGERHLRELQAELSQISRVSAVGTLAAALAHELNQPLTAIASYVQAAAALMPPPLSANDLELNLALTEVGREAIRAGRIIRRLREFIANGALDRRRVGVDDLVTEACALGFVGAKAANLSSSQRVEPGLPALLVEPVQIQQVIVNLILNAIHAAGPGGWVRVEAVRSGKFVQIGVSDSGSGVAAELQANLFDPFVTTKSDGMGLGLAICRTIVELHGGDLWFEPAPCGGAAFQFTIPTMAETEDG